MSGAPYLQGVFGNKCAGQHNLKTVHFKETLASGNFLTWSSAICVFFCSTLSTLVPRTAAASSSVTMVGATPTSSSWRCPGSTTACQLWFHFQEEIKGRWCEIWWIMELGEHLNTFIHSQLLKIEAAMAFWATAWQKTSSVQTCLVFSAQIPL